MPNETRAYVPQLLALKRLIQDSERYGIALPEVPNEPAVDCTVALPGDMDAGLAARLAGISGDEFRQLNAGVRKGVISQATHPNVCLPVAAVQRFRTELARHKGKLASLAAHTVKIPTSLQTVAKLYRTTPEVIREINQIPKGMRLKPGATVMVPRRPGSADIPALVAMHAQLLIEPEPRKKSTTKKKSHPPAKRKPSAKKGVST